MDWKDFLIGLFSIFAIFLFFVYWFLPFNDIKFGAPKSPEFNIGNLTNEMQFYKNMRFQNTEISYKIDSDCSLQRKNDMIRAFDYLEEFTSLNFYPVSNGEEITVTCKDEKIPSGNGLFTAGEGGPTKILSGENFYIILEGKILLLRDSNCERPNIAIHELLHVLGFNHSENENNIMYPVSSCSQTLGSEIPEKINGLYNFPSLPDLTITNVSAKIEGRYLDLDLSVHNIGLSDSGEGRIIIYADEEKTKEISLKEIKIGQGLDIELRNIWIEKRTYEKLKIKVEIEEDELSLDNNEITLEKLPG